MGVVAPLFSMSALVMTVTGPLAFDALEARSGDLILSTFCGLTPQTVPGKAGPLKADLRMRACASKRLTWCKSLRVGKLDG